MLTPSQAGRIRLAAGLLAMHDTLDDLSPLRCSIPDGYEREKIDEAWIELRTAINTLVERVA